MSATLTLRKKNEDAIWNDWFSLYCNYKDEYGCEPDGKVIYRGRHLGAWCKNQRQAARKGSLPSDRTQRLADAGFVFLAREVTWAHWIRIYCAYKKEYGREPLTGCIYQGQNLGVWCSNQRQAFYRGRLSQEQLQQLIDIGFIFDVYEVNWNELLDLYREYKLEYGSEPKDRATYRGRGLGSWCKHQRELYKVGKLSPERAKMLKELKELCLILLDFLFLLHIKYN